MFKRANDRSVTSTFLPNDRDATKYKHYALSLTHAGKLHMQSNALKALRKGQLFQHLTSNHTPQKLRGHNPYSSQMQSYFRHVCMKR